MGILNSDVGLTWQVSSPILEALGEWNVLVDYLGIWKSLTLKYDFVYRPDLKK